MSLNGLLSLVVCSNKSDLEAISTQFSSVGLQILVEESIIKIKDILKDKYPRLILIEVDKGREERLHIISEIRKLGKYKEVPIAILTCAKCQKIQKTARDMGVIKILDTPTNNNDLNMLLKWAEKECEKIVLEKDYKKSGIKMSVTFDGDIISINELGYAMVSPVKFKPRDRLKIESTLLDSIGASKCVQRVVAESDHAAGGFKTMLTFAGVDEATAAKIRTFRAQ